MAVAASRAAAGSSFHNAPNRRIAGRRVNPFPAPLHAAAFVVDGDQQFGATQRMHLGGERLELLGRSEIAGKQDEAADQWVREAAAVIGGQFSPVDVDHQRAARKI